MNHDDNNPKPTTREVVKMVTYLLFLPITIFHSDAFWKEKTKAQRRQETKNAWVRWGIAFAFATLTHLCSKILTTIATNYKIPVPRAGIFLVEALTTLSIVPTLAGEIKLGENQ